MHFVMHEGTGQHYYKLVLLTNYYSQATNRAHRTGYLNKVSHLTNTNCNQMTNMT